MAGQRFAWPLEGRVILSYGQKEDGVSSRGVVIESPNKGIDVVAARDGKVVLVDPKLKGYGKTVILEHSEDFSTIYARVAEIVVKPGQYVRRGEIIAKAGRADSNRSLLYFEIRKQARAEDPLPFIEPR